MGRPGRKTLHVGDFALCSVHSGEIGGRLTNGGFQILRRHGYPRVHDELPTVGQDPEAIESSGGTSEQTQLATALTPSAMAITFKWAGSAPAARHDAANRSTKSSNAASTAAAFGKETSTLQLSQPSSASPSAIDVVVHFRGAFANGRRLLQPLSEDIAAGSGASAQR